MDLSNERQARLDELLLYAAALDPASRDAWLRCATGDDAQLRAELRRRFAAVGDVPPGFLAEPTGLAAAALAEGQGEASAGDPALTGAAARYEVGERLGEGGMAEVFGAFDRQLQRPVALKLLHGDAPASAGVLREARAQARVQHDHVLDVYETGELDGRPYIAMRRVSGPTLLSLRGTASLETQLRLLAAVADGLHAAHRQGLIHRDVKPSNVLIQEEADGELKPYVSDFGIAADPAELTAPIAALAGTPAYMAPEVLAGTGVVDRRADVYGLGVTAYQLFAGELPFTGASPAELIERVLAGEPRPPRELVPGLPREVEAIVCKCLARDPEARYPSARAVADDLRRFLDGEVVEAYTATLAYRLARFAARHKVLLRVVATAAVLLVAALAVAAFLGVAAMRANDKAARRQLQAENLVGFMLTDLRGKLDAVGRLDVLDAVGEEAMRYFAAVPAAELSSDELARRSQALYQIGEVEIRRGRVAAAVAPLSESLALAKALAAREPGSAERLFGLGQSHFWVGYAQWQRGDAAAARPHFAEYLAVAERLTALDPQNRDYQLELAYAHSNLGSFAQRQGDLTAARERFTTTLKINEALVESDPANLDWRFELAATHNLLGVVEQELGRLDAAAAHFRAELTQRRSLSAAAPENFTFRDHLGTAYDYLGNLLSLRGRWDEAEAELRQARDLFTALALHDPENAVWRRKLALVEAKLARAAWGAGRGPAAVTAAAARLRAAAEALLERESDGRIPAQLLARASYWEAMALHDAGRHAEAWTSADVALTILTGLGAGTNPEVRYWLDCVHLLLGSIAAAAGEPQQAQTQWQEVVAVTVESTADEGTMEDTTTVDPLPRTAEWQIPRALALLYLGRGAEAESILAAVRAEGIEDRWLSRALTARPHGERAAGNGG